MKLINMDEILKLFKENIKNCWLMIEKQGFYLVEELKKINYIAQIIKRKKISKFSIIFNDEKIKYYKPRSEEKKIINYFLKKYKVQMKSFFFTDNEIKESFPQAIYFNEAPLVWSFHQFYIFFVSKKIKKKLMFY